MEYDTGEDSIPTIPFDITQLVNDVTKPKRA
jgi:hypothetical protein